MSEASLPDPLKIGPLSIRLPTVLAPMAGYTDWPFRLLARENNCGLVVTEVISAAGMVYGSKRTRHYLVVRPGENPIGCQLYGGDPAQLADAAALVEETGRFDFVDINCGCPVPKIITKGAGVALMKDPEKLNQMISAVRNAVSFPVTAKTRIGLSPDQVNISEVAHAIEDGGAHMLAIHARYASERHTGDADWEALAAIKAERSLPIVGNGGVAVAQDALDMMEQTGVDGVMIGRAAIGNPWIFDEIRALWEGDTWSPPSLEERRKVIERHLADYVVMIEENNRSRKRTKYSSEVSACMNFRAHIVKYLAGFQGWKALTRELNELNSMELMIQAIDRVYEAEEKQMSGAR